MVLCATRCDAGVGATGEVRADVEVYSAPQPQLPGSSAVSEKPYLTVKNKFKPVRPSAQSDASVHAPPATVRGVPLPLRLHLLLMYILNR